MKVSQSTGGQAAAARCKLQERLPLAGIHSDEYVHEPQKAGTLLRVTQLGLRVRHNVLPGPLGVLLAAQHLPDLLGRKRGQLVQREHLTEASVERGQLLRDALLQAEVDRQVAVLLDVVDRDVDVGPVRDQIRRLVAVVLRAGQIGEGKGQIFQRHAARFGVELEFADLQQLLLRGEIVVLFDVLLLLDQFLELLEEFVPDGIDFVEIFLRQDAVIPAAVVGQLVDQVAVAFLTLREESGRQIWRTFRRTVG